jgi:hypothetical protein
LQRRQVIGSRENVVHGGLRGCRVGPGALRCRMCCVLSTSPRGAELPVRR